MDKKDAEFLVSERAGSVLQQLRTKFHVHDDEFKIANFLSKNTDFDAHERAIILEQLTQETRAKMKFSYEGTWFFERSALEQASSQPIAFFHHFISRLCAQNTQGKLKILDGCAGLGVDSHILEKRDLSEVRIWVDDLSIKQLKIDESLIVRSGNTGFNEINMSDLGAEITAVEKDEAIYTLMKNNLKEHGDCKCVNADVLDFLRDTSDLRKFKFMFFDPSRRSSEIKRIENVDDFSPSPFEISRILNDHSFQGYLGFKLAPKTSENEIKQYFEDADIFTVSLKNEIKETFVLSSRHTFGGKFAVVLRDKKDFVDIFVQSADAEKISDLPIENAFSCNFLIHPAPALRNPGLIPADMLHELGKLSCLSIDIPLIQAKAPLTSKISQTYEIIGTTKADFVEVKKELRRLNCYAFSIKNYYAKLNNFILNALTSKKGQPAYLFFVRTAEKTQCIITRRVTQE